MTRLKNHFKVPSGARKSVSKSYWLMIAARAKRKDYIAAVKLFIGITEKKLRPASRKNELQV